METETIIGIVVVFIVFLVVRELWCWYWKVNERIAQNTKIISKLAYIEEHLETISRHRARQEHVPGADSRAEVTPPLQE